jgi:S-DNA-T family DNA segregation ATPase FtsK/SpoIIIE
MAKKDHDEKIDRSEKKRKYSKESSSIPLGKLPEETLRGVFAVLLLILAMFFILSPFGVAGPAGNKLFEVVTLLLGYGYYLLPILSIMLAISFIRESERHFAVVKTVGSVLFFLSGIGLITLALPLHGGVLGSIITSPLISLFYIYIPWVILFGFLVISFLVMFEAELKLETILFPLHFYKNWKSAKGEPKTLVPAIAVQQGLTSPEEKKIDDKIHEAEVVSRPKSANEQEVSEKKSDRETKGTGVAVETGFLTNFVSSTTFTPPPLSLLEGDRGKPGVGDIKANANLIKRTFQNFGIDVEMDEIAIGPSITRYSLKPAEGVKLSRIVALQSNLELALAAHPIRIEAPIPGKSLVGIEIPNTTKTTVGLGTLLSSEDFQKSPKPLLVSLGKGISGKSYFADIAKMPHLLIAGATGSGKSVTIHAIVNSLLYRNSPEQLRLIMIDPKRVELTLYNKIPHLLTPVITDAKKAIMALKWAAKEMDRRYNILEAEAVRDIDSYHKNVVAPAYAKTKKEPGNDGASPTLPESMPYIVILIDELADIMQSYPRELESSIVRLAQMSRAVGIHLILSTQRPSVNVITGLIKANVPSRIALQVASQIDSRTILDASGAEKLLGAGDMLYLSGDMSKPQRIQSAFITETEVKNIVKFLVDAYKDEIPQTIEFNQTNGVEIEKNSIFDAMESTGGNDADDDDLYEEARQIVVDSGIAATSYLQRKLRVGYARAARLMDILEERGVIGPADGSKRRDVIGAKPKETNDGPADISPTF